MIDNPHDGSVTIETAIPDTITSQQVRSSINLLTEIALSDPEVVANTRQNLLDRLEGVAEAVSALVISKGAVKTTDLSFLGAELPPDLPLLWRSNIYQRYMQTDGESGGEGELVLAVHPARGSLARLSVDYVQFDPYQRLPRYSSAVPTIRKIYDLRNRGDWNDKFTAATDYRPAERTSQFHFPFSDRFGLVDSTVSYFDITQELVTDFLGSISANGFNIRKSE